MKAYTISNAWPVRVERSLKGAMRQAIGGHIHHLTVMLDKKPGVRLLGSRPGLSFGRSVMGYDFMSLVCARIENGVIRGTVADCWTNKSYEAVIPLEKVRWVHVMYEGKIPLPPFERGNTCGNRPSSGRIPLLKGDKGGFEKEAA